MKALRKAYKFDEKDTIEMFYFLAQLKRACNCNGVSEGEALWIVATSIKDRLAPVLTSWITFPKDNKTTHRPPKT